MTSSLIPSPLPHSLGKGTPVRAADPGRMGSDVHTHAKLHRMPLTLKESHDVVSRAHERAAALGIKVTVAVVDEGGLLITLGRMDGAPPLSPQVAEAKAVGAAMLYRDGAGLAELAKDRPGLLQRRGPPRAGADRPRPRLGPHQAGRQRPGCCRCQRRAAGAGPRMRGGRPKLNLTRRRGS